MLATIPGATNITTSTQNNGSEFDLTIDRAKAAALGLNTQTVAETLRAAINGTKATTITLPNQNIDVIVKLDLNPDYTDPSDTTQTTIDSINNLSIQGPSGSVLLGSILNDSLGASNADISHNDQNRIETVSAYPGEKTTTSCGRRRLPKAHRRARFARRRHASLTAARPRASTSHSARCSWRSWRVSS